MEYLTKLAQNTPPTLHAHGQEYVHVHVHAWAIFTYLDNYRLFELSEDVYVRSVPLVYTQKIHYHACAEALFTEHYMIIIILLLFYF